MLYICLILSNLYAFPVDKSVQIVAKKGEEADDHGEIGKRLDRGKHPKPDKNDVVCGIRKGVTAAAQKQ